VQLKAPGKTEPDEGRTARLKIKPMSGRSGVDQRDRDLTVVPSADTGGIVQLRELYTQFLQPLGYAREVMLEPVRRKHRLAVCRFDQILKGVELAVMDINDLAAVVIDRAVRHLTQLARERRGVLGSDLAVRERQHQLT